MLANLSLFSSMIKRCFVVVSLCSAMIYAEAFGNMAVYLPNIAIAFYDTPLIKHKKPWGLSHQYAVGASYMQAIDYRLWWIAETTVGFGQLREASNESIATILAGAGLRFNILDEDFRPHVGLMLHYLHFIGDGVNYLPLKVDWPVWVGLKPFFGLEWLFFPEMSLALIGSYGFYLHLSEPFRHSLSTQLAYIIYF